MVWGLEDCDTAHDLLFQAYHLHSTGGDVAQQKRLFYKSLRLCANQPKVHNALAKLFKQAGQYESAIQHYKQALTINPRSYPAWEGLGESYYKQSRFPLSADAYAHICHISPAIKARIVSMIDNQALNSIAKHKIRYADELQIIYNSSQRHALNKRLSECAIDFKLSPKQVFFNLVFETKNSVLHEETKTQLTEIASALKHSDVNSVIVHGHTDRRGFAKLSELQSAEFNVTISKQRAEAVANKLIRLGMDKNRFKIVAHGSKQPLINSLINHENSVEYFEKSRRVEIEVQSLAKKQAMEDDAEDDF